jgi:sarcosine oxidase
VVVVGLGAAGSATVGALARRGVRVVGIDRYSPPHAHGSSHGDTRITRLAVGEGDAYVPLVARSHELWRELEARSGAELLVACGGLILGDDRATGHHGVDGFVAATIRVARAHGIDHEVLTADEVHTRFEVLAPTGGVGYYEPTAGYLRAEACIAATLADAEQSGAILRRGEHVRRLTATDEHVVVETDRGTVSAARAVVAAGPWLPELLPELASSVTVHREVLHWFEPEPDRLGAYERLPVFIWLHGQADGALVYGFPAIGGARGGVKVATETFDAPTTPDLVDRDVTDEEIAAMHAGHVAGRLLGLSARSLRAQACLYAVTPDFGFLLGAHPARPNVVVASPCSGHGFKHSPAVGECAAALALGERPGLDLSAFSLSRLG